MLPRNNGNPFVPPPKADLTDERDREVWLDLVAAAIQGYCGSSWSKDGKTINMPSANVAADKAVEVADFVFKALKERS